MSSAIASMAMASASEPVPRPAPAAHVHTNACWWDLSQAGWVCPSAMAKPRPPAQGAGPDLAVGKPVPTATG